MYYIFHVFLDENNKNNINGTNVSQNLFKLAISKNNLFFKLEENTNWDNKNDQWIFVRKKMENIKPFDNWIEGDIVYLSKHVWAMITEIRDFEIKKEDIITNFSYKLDDNDENINLKTLDENPTIDHLKNSLNQKTVLTDNSLVKKFNKDNEDFLYDFNKIFD